MKNLKNNLDKYFDNIKNLQINIGSKSMRDKLVKEIINIVKYNNDKN